MRGLLPYQVLVSGKKLPFKTDNTLKILDLSLGNFAQTLDWRTSKTLIVVPNRFEGTYLITFCVGIQFDYDSISNAIPLLGAYLLVNDKVKASTQSVIESYSEEISERQRPEDWGVVSCRKVVKLYAGDLIRFYAGVTHSKNIKYKGIKLLSATFQKIEIEE
jgi:hypothetical protein